MAIVTLRHLLNAVARSKQVYIDWLRATVLFLSYLGVTSDLRTQCMSREEEAESMLNADTCVLTKASVGTSRQTVGNSKQPANGNRNAACSQQMEDIDEAWILGNAVWLWGCWVTSLQSAARHDRTGR